MAFKGIKVNSKRQKKYSKRRIKLRMSLPVPPPVSFRKEQIVLGSAHFSEKLSPFDCYKFSLKTQVVFPPIIFSLALAALSSYINLSSQQVASFIYFPDFPKMCIKSISKMGQICFLCMHVTIDYFSQYREQRQLFLYRK